MFELEVFPVLPKRPADDGAVDVAEVSDGLLVPKRPLADEFATPPKGFEDAVVAGVCCDTELCAPPTFQKVFGFCSCDLLKLKPDPRPDPAPATPDGGGPAGVVDTLPNEKPPPGLLVAGVVLPA